ncbi:MAG: M15 family metallopeptidase [Syntrophobacter sp.]
MRVTRSFLVRFYVILAVFLLFPISARGGSLPEDFVYVPDVIPDIRVELRYYSNHNFVGERIDGYLEPKCILTRQAAEALGKVQKDLGKFGLGLKIYDSYRPQRAVDHFVRWAKDLDDTRMKKEFYPDVNKQDLFKDGYIASKSGHSRGSTVDLTIVAIDPQRPDADLDMGTGFDFFSPRSWPEDPQISAAQRANRMLLREVMEKHGFIHYSKEWWHFTLNNEPYPKTFFDFPVN